MMRLRAAGWLLLLAVLAGCGARTTTPSAATPGAPAQGSPQGDSWDSIKLLPDFSGAWTQPTDNSLGRALFEDCCVPGKGKAPLTPRYQALRDATAERVARGESGADNLINCLPDGVPGLILHGIAFQFWFRPGEVLLMFENGEVRRIHTDGRKHPESDQLYASVQGHSIGHWESGTLVVDTIGMLPDAMLFYTGGMKVTRNTQVIERFSLQDKDTLLLQTTIEDAEIFTRPYEYDLRFTRLLREADFLVGCRATNRDTENTLDLTPPPE